MRCAITGATGFLGIHLMRELLSGDGGFTFLTRRDPVATMVSLTESLNAIGTPAELVEQLPERCSVVRVELTSPHFGLSSSRFHELADSVDAVWHVAASTELASTLEDMRAVNVTGTARVLEFVSVGRRRPDLFHIGTAFVAGRRALHGRVFEEELDDSAGFETTYEHSKYEGEVLVREFARSSGRRVVVMRPSILITDRAPHPAIPVHTLLQLNSSAEAGKRLRGLSGSRSRASLPPLRLVGDRRGHLNFMPVEEAASAMVGLSRTAPSGLTTCNIVHHHDVAVPVVTELLQRMSPLPLTLVSEPLTNPNLYERSVIRSPARVVIPYLAHRRTFDDTTSRRLIGPPTRETTVDLNYLLSGIGFDREIAETGANEPAPDRIAARTIPAPQPIPAPPLIRDVTAVRGLTFVVTTGRSGSTAVSRILRAHPDVLSLNEFFLSVRTSTTPDTILTAEQFWQVLADPHPLFDPMIRGGSGIPELLYPHLSGTRFDADSTGIPAISLMTLPHLSDTPDMAFDELSVEVSGWPEQRVAQHFRSLFGWLAARFGGSVVVERSGMSLGWATWLRHSFPDARFVHLYRNGPDTALSMSRQTGYRMMALIQDGLDLLALGDAGTERYWQFDPAAIPAEAAELLGDRIDSDYLADLDIPLSRFGRMWSQLVHIGTTALADLPPDRHLPLSFERLLTRPTEELTQLAAFLDIDPDPTWLARSAATLDTTRIGTAHQLTADDYRALIETCDPGTQLLSL
ncbi:SDR family oxidoreductase [Nocardia sp. NPDC059195]|uniref:SDR family oxidoreductase n=2 Tax=unclassified Nocardia TaxID=2637762 RepID=UPI0036779302